MAKLNIICQLSETLIVALSKVRENNPERTNCYILE